MAIKVKPPIEPSDVIKEHYKKMGQKRWIGKTKEEKKEYMSMIAKIRWSNVSKKDRIKYLKSIGLCGEYHKK